MSDAVAVRDDQRRPIIGLGFLKRFYGVRVTSTHGHARDVNVTVADSFHGEIFFPCSFAPGSKFCDSCARRSLGHLAACVRIDFRIEHENVNIRASAEHVVETASSDVVRPTISPEEPNAAAN